MKRISLALTFASLFVAEHWAAAQGTAFTYQGVLNQSNGPVTGLFDVRFTVYGDPAANLQVGLPRTNNAVVVSNGLFTTTVDFDRGPWDNQPRWMELAIKSSGTTNGFTPLSPRQLVAAAPRSVFAISAGEFHGAIDNSQIPAGIARLNANQTVTGFYSFASQPGNPPFSVDSSVLVT